MIAAVFDNRLRIGMKLDCDPTTIYAALLEGRYRGTIYRSDLDSDNPYNTYRHAGLPPGPIANPGLASMQRGAASGGHPTRSTSWRGRTASGAHEFSSNIAAHEAATAAVSTCLQQASPLNSSCASTWQRSSRRPITESRVARTAGDAWRRCRRAICATCCAIPDCRSTSRTPASASTPSRSWSNRCARCCRSTAKRTAAGHRERARYCRRQVIAAKDRAKFLAGKHPHEKEEMAQWMLVWLENPEVFPAWVEARKTVLATNSHR